MRTFGRAYRFDVEVLEANETVSRERWTVHTQTFGEALAIVMAEAPITVKYVEGVA